MAALTVLELKETYPHIRLILDLPCKKQPHGWRENDKKMFDQILSQADRVLYASENNQWGVMPKRSRHMVDNSNICVCYLRKVSGDTAYTVNYAVQQGMQVINIALRKKGPLSKSC